MGDVIDELIATRNSDAERRLVSDRLALLRSEIIKENSTPLWIGFRDELRRLTEKNNASGLPSLEWSRSEATKNSHEILEVRTLAYPVVSLRIARTSDRFWEYWIEITPGPFAAQRRECGRVELRADNDEVYLRRASDAKLKVASVVKTIFRSQ